jgi:hypothetical protein
MVHNLIHYNASYSTALTILGASKYMNGKTETAGTSSFDIVETVE